MNKLFIFTARNVKEIIRDVTSLIFCLIFPLVMLVIMQVVFSGIDNMPEMFLIENYAPGIAVFGYTFTMLYIALMISGDRESAFMTRISLAPVSPLCIYSVF